MRRRLAQWASSCLPDSWRFRNTADRGDSTVLTLMNSRLATCLYG